MFLLRNAKCEMRDVNQEVVHSFRRVAIVDKRVVLISSQRVTNEDEVFVLEACQSSRVIDVSPICKRSSRS